MELDGLVARVRVCKCGHQEGWHGSNPYGSWCLTMLWFEDTGKPDRVCPCDGFMEATDAVVL